MAHLCSLQYLVDHLRANAVTTKYICISPYFFQDSTVMAENFFHHNIHYDLNDMLIALSEPGGNTL